MQIIEYKEYYRQQVIDVILHIQNEEAKINLSVEEQPDLLDIESYYFSNGGKFWIAVENKVFIGTIALMNKGNNNGVLKNFLSVVIIVAEKSGFYRTDKANIPFEYDYPDRDSYLYLLKL